MGCEAIKKIGRKALILVHTSDLLVNVWNDSLIKSFGPGIMGHVGIIGGSLSDSDRMDMKVGARSNDFEENMKKDIVIGTFQTFNNRLDKLSQYKFGLMIVDECIPIDSEIWTKDGIINYEDLSLDNGNKVWSRGDDNLISYNNFKKIKTRFKYMYKSIVETGDILVCSLDHKVLSNTKDGIKFIEIDKANNIARSLITIEEQGKDAELKRLYLKYETERKKYSQKILNFNDWQNKVVDDFIFLDILRQEYRGFEQGYTLTVDKDHNYLVNGFVLKNCHHVPSTMFRKVNSAIKAPFKMGLSATTKRLDGMEKDCFGQLGDIQSSVSIRELINKGILAEPRFQSPIIVDDRVINEIENCGQSGLMFSQFVKKSSAGSEKKKNYIVNVCKSVAAGNRKFLLFTDYVSKEEVFVRDMYAEALLNEGVRVGIIDQGMGSDERSAVFKFLDSGDISGIVFGKLGSEGVNIPSVDVVVMANAIKCVSGDILIPTDKGIIRAEDLNIVKPSIVSTMDLKDRSIINAEICELYNFDQENTVRIMTNNGYEIEGSLSHLVITINKDGNLLYKSLSDIRYGDDVLICGANLYGNDVKLNYNIIPANTTDRYVLEIINKIKNHGIIDKICKYKHIKVNFKELKENISPNQKISPQKLQEKIRYRFNKKGVSVSRPKYNQDNDSWFYTFDLTYSGIFTVYEFKKDFFIPEYVNEELAELLGYIVSEGYISSEYSTIEIVNKNDLMISRIIYLFSSIFGYDVELEFLKNRKIDRVRCCAPTIIGFFKYLDVEYRSGEKRVPWCILRSSKKIQLEFLKALFGGDGGATNRNNIMYGSKSKRLCDELHIMLLNMGIISKKDFNGLGWQIIITSKEADKFMKDIGFFDNREFVYNIVRHDHKRLTVSHYLDGCIAFIDKVVAKVKGKNKLYDMNIDQHHSFIGGGFINHNSPITFTQRVGRVMRKIPGKDFADVYEILLDIPTEYKWSEFNFAEYRAEGFTKLSYKVE